MLTNRERRHAELILEQSLVSVACLAKYVPGHGAHQCCHHKHGGIHDEAEMKPACQLYIVKFD